MHRIKVETPKAFGHLNKVWTKESFKTITFAELVGLLYLRGDKSKENLCFTSLGFANYKGLESPKREWDFHPSIWHCSTKISIFYCNQIIIFIVISPIWSLSIGQRLTPNQSGVVSNLLHRDL